MKIYLTHLISFVFSFNLQAITAPENAEEAESWYQSMQRGVEKWTASTDKTAQIENLGDYVRKFGQKIPYHPDPRWHKVYEEAQAILITIPGHAKYFTDELERLRLDPKSDYERIRATYLAETLKHLPSPEAVQILGQCLGDMRDTPYDENPKYNEAVRSGKLRPFDWSPTPQNAWLATYAFSNIGLQDPPFEPVPDIYQIRFSPLKESLPKFRAWWEEVKSGKRAFSFKGQNVEYRFKPDGTWDTTPITNSPDDGPKEEGNMEPPSDSKNARPDDGPMMEKLPKEPRESKMVTAKESPAQLGASADLRWVWVAVGLVVAVLGGIWLKRRLV